MRFTDMADEMFGAAQGALPAGVRLATAKRGGVTITRVEIAREGLAKPRGRYVTLEMPSVSVLDERDAAVIETCAAELRALLPPEAPYNMRWWLGEKKLGIILTLCLVMLSIVSSLYFFPRVFGDAETKAMYKIESILKSYVNTKSYNLVDLMNHTFHAGTYEYQNDKLQFSFGIKTD